MKGQRICQEVLKLIACLCMLIDHVGAVLFPQYLWLRIVGRMAFPVYCFLLAEGACHTRNEGKYLIRLGIAAIISEIPFDLALFGRLTLLHQNVMITLLLGLLMLLCFKRVSRQSLRPIIAIPFVWAAELLRSDYGGLGVALVALFYLTRQMPHKQLVRTIVAALIYYMMDSAVLMLGAVSVPIEMFALLSMIPICLYSGARSTKSKGLQRAFYLFYPAHLLVLYCISVL